MNIAADLVAVRGVVVNKAPSPGPKRSGKVMLADRTVLSAYPENLDLIQIGAEYEFGVKVTFKDGGKQYFDISKVKPIETSPQLAARPQFVGTDEVLAQRRPTAQAQAPQYGNPMPAGRPQTALDRPANGEAFNPPPPRRQAPAAPPADRPAFPIEWNRPTHPRDSRRMFICAMMTAEIAAGRIPADEDAYAERCTMWSRVHARAIDVTESMSGESNG